MPKALTREQLQRRKDQAVRFTRDMLGDAGRAEEIASESLEDYAQRRGIESSNPRRGAHVMARKTVAAHREELEDLKEQVRDLEDENETLQPSWTGWPRLRGARMKMRMRTDGDADDDVEDLE